MNRAVLTNFITAMLLSRCDYFNGIGINPTIDGKRPVDYSSQNVCLACCAEPRTAEGGGDHEQQ
jgi:hypothetical protein